MKRLWGKQPVPRPQRLSTLSLPSAILLDVALLSGSPHLATTCRALNQLLHRLIVFCGRDRFDKSVPFLPKDTEDYSSMRQLTLQVVWDVDNRKGLHPSTKKRCKALMCQAALEHLHVFVYQGNGGFGGKEIFDAMIEAGPRWKLTSLVLAPQKAHFEAKHLATINMSGLKRLEIGFVDESLAKIIPLDLPNLMSAILRETSYQDLPLWLNTFSRCTRLTRLEISVPAYVKDVYCCFFIASLQHLTLDVVLQKDLAVALLPAGQPAQLSHLQLTIGYETPELFGTLTEFLKSIVPHCCMDLRIKSKCHREDVTVQDWQMIPHLACKLSDLKVLRVDLEGNPASSKMLESVFKAIGECEQLEELQWHWDADDRCHNVIYKGNRPNFQWEWLRPVSSLKNLREMNIRVGGYKRTASAKDVDFGQKRLRVCQVHSGCFQMFRWENGRPTVYKWDTLLHFDNL